MSLRIAHVFIGPLKTHFSGYLLVQ